MTLSHLAVGFLVVVAMVLGVIIISPVIPAKNVPVKVPEDVYVFNGVSPSVPGITYRVSREPTLNNTVLFSITNNTARAINVVFYDKAVLETGKTINAGIKGNDEIKIFPGATESVSVYFDKVDYPIKWYIPFNIYTNIGTYECRMNFSWLPR